MRNLATRGISAAKWGVFLSASRIVLQVGAQAVLARVLGPEAYGLFGIALIVITLVTYFSEIGVGMFILQRENLSEQDIRFTVTWQVMLGVATAATLFVAAPYVAQLLNDARVEPLVQWLGLSCVLTAAAYVSTHLLYRDLEFRTVGFIDLASYTTGYLLVGLPLALSGVGVTTLIAAFLTQEVVKLAATAFIRRHSWRPLFRHPDALAILRLGRDVWFTLLVTWVISSIDRILIARLMGASSVGLYNAAYNLSSTAVSSMRTLGTTFLASGARARAEPERLGQAFLQIFAGIWVIGAPLFVLAAMVSDTIVAVIYGPKWVGAGAILQALLISAPAWLSFGMTTPLLWNTERGYLESLIQLPIVVVYVLSLLLVIDFGLVTVAWVVAGMLGVRALVTAVVACRAVGLKFTELLPQLARGAALCALVVIGAQVGDRIATFVGSSIIVAAGLTALVPIVLVLLLIAWVPSIIGTHATALVARFSPRLTRQSGLASSP